MTGGPAVPRKVRVFALLLAVALAAWPGVADARSHHKKTPAQPAATAQASKPPATPPVAATSAPTTAASTAAAPTAAAPTGAAIAFDGVGDRLAVFVRYGTLWLVAEGEWKEAHPVVSGADHAAVGQPEALAADGATIFRLAIPATLNPVVSRAPSGWQIQLLSAAPQIVSASSSLKALVGRAALTVAVKDPAQPIKVVDPATGDRLIAVPTLPGVAYAPVRRLAEVELLPTVQGIVVRPLAEDVDVAIDSAGLAISTETGLKLSDPPEGVLPPGAIAAARTAKPLRGRDRIILDWPTWRLPAAEPEPARQMIEHRAALLQEKDRAPAFIELARLMLSQAKAAECIGYLDLAQGIDADVAARDDVRVVRGAALALAGRPDDAEAQLSGPNIGGTEDESLWRGLDAARTGRWPDALTLFRAGLDRLADYPAPLYRPLALAATEAAIRGGDIAVAKLLLDQLRSSPTASLVPDAAFAYFDGRIAEAAGKPDDALAAWKPATEARDQYYRTRAEFASIETALASKAIDAKAATERLDRLRFAWRGDDFEIEVLSALGRAASDAEDFESATAAYRQAATLAGPGPVGDAAKAQLVALFRHLFVDGAADKLPPIRALGLYQSMKDVAPGDADEAKVMDRLAARTGQMDLLGQAADILESELAHETDPAAKGRVGARAAALHLLDNKPELAIRVLDQTEADAIPPDVKSDRKLLRARALSKEGRPDDGLKLIAGDYGADADDLRVDIGWSSGRWRLAADALGRLSGPAPASGTIDDAKAALVLRRAVALDMAGDAAGIAQVRREFAPAFTASKSASLFEVLTHVQGDGSLADIRIIRSEIAEVDLFAGFLKTYREHLGGA